jgi:hypothetical protein
MAGAAAAAAVLLLAAAHAPAEDEGRTVYYQITNEDGSSRDSSTVPQTNKGISRVLRITRVEQGVKGYEIMSTGPQTLTMVSRGQTYKTDMVWNGKAWVAPSDEPGVAIVVESGPPRSADAAGSPDTPRLRAALTELAARLLESDDKLAAGEKALAGQQALAATVAKARTDIRACLAEVVDAARKLSPPAEKPEAPAPPSGDVTPASQPAAEPQAGGIVRPIQQTASLPYRVQVWKLPPAEGPRTCRVAIAHADAGLPGAFYYVAYADTDGDGRPDKLIARSPLARAARAGQWTQWEFAADQKNVFVGKAWDRADTVHYHVEKIRIDDDWRGLSSETYVSINAWGMPTWRCGQGFDNIRVWTRPRTPPAE